MFIEGRKYLLVFTLQYVSYVINAVHLRSLHDEWLRSLLYPILLTWTLWSTQRIHHSQPTIGIIRASNIGPARHSASEHCWCSSAEPLKF